MIQQETRGELFRIETEKTYPSDYDELVDYGREEPDEDSRPTLSSHVENMDEYDVVFLGYPNWWFDMPMAVYSFLDEYDFSGKTNIPFCTHGGSGFSNTVATFDDDEKVILQEILCLLEKRGKFSILHTVTSNKRLEFENLVIIPNEQMVKVKDVPIEVQDSHSFTK